MQTIEKGAPDEVYIILKWGLEIRIHDMIDELCPLFISNKIDINNVGVDEVSRLHRSQEIKMEHVDAMNDSRRDQPILVACIQNEGWVIDGNHRLKKKEIDGFTKCDVIFVNSEMLIKFTQPLISGKSERRKRKQMEEIRELLES